MLEIGMLLKLTIIEKADLIKTPTYCISNDISSRLRSRRVHAGSELTRDPLNTSTPLFSHDEHRLQRCLPTQKKYMQTVFFFPSLLFI